MLPVLSSQQDDRKKMKNIVRRTIKTSSFLLFPIIMILFVSAESIVRILLTEKWMPSVPFLQIYCITFALWPIHTANLQAIYAAGRSDLVLRIEIFKKSIGVLILIITIPYGIYAIALGGVASSIISTFINSFPNKNLLDYKYMDQITDLIPSGILSLAVGLIIYTFSFLNVHTIIILLLQIITGLTLYFLVAKILKMDSYLYLYNILRSTNTKIGHWIKKTK
jgi:O-antigen/teichoic acid export membrane protein